MYTLQRDGPAASTLLRQESSPSQSPLLEGLLWEKQQLKWQWPAVLLLDRHCQRMRGLDGETPAADASSAQNCRGGYFGHSTRMHPVPKHCSVRVPQDYWQQKRRVAPMRVAGNQKGAVRCEVLIAAPGVTAWQNVGDR